MRKLSIIAMMALAFMIGSVSLTAASADDDDDSLELTAVSNQFKEFDTAPKGLSVGDHYVFSDDVYEDGKKVGSLDGTCVLTRVRGARYHEQCVVTVSLPDGLITSQGVIVFDKHFDNKFTIAITGGTDDYSDAGGEAHVEFLSETKTSIEINLD